MLPKSFPPIQKGLTPMIDVSASRPFEATLSRQPQVRGRTRPRPIPRRTRRGLVNVVLTLAITAVVIVAILAMYGGLATSLRTQVVQTHLATAEARIREVYTNQPQYEAKLTSILWSVMPSNAIQGTDTSRKIVTPWGGEIFAGGGATPDNDGTGAASNNLFYITVLDLPEKACETLAQSYLGRSDVVGIDVEKTKTTAFSDLSKPAEVAKFDTASEIQAGCDGGDNDKIAIVFRG